MPIEMQTAMILLRQIEVVAREAQIDGSASVVGSAAEDIVMLAERVLRVPIIMRTSAGKRRVTQGRRERLVAHGAKE